MMINMHYNQIILTKNIILICFYEKYSYYTDVIEKYKKNIIVHTWKRNFMSLEFSYKKDDNSEFENDEMYNNYIVNSICDIFDNIKIKCLIDLKINNSELKNINLIQKIVNLDYYSHIYFEKKFVSDKIDFKRLIKCDKVIYKNSYYKNSLNLPERLDTVLLYYEDKKNLIFNIPSGLRNIYVKKYSFEHLFFNFDDVVIKKLFVVNAKLDIKNTEIFHDYDLLIIKKNIPNTKFIDFNNLPYSLKILHIYDKINQEILSLPNSIEELKINYHDKNLLENLPSTLKKIHLDYNIYQINVNILSMLPDSLEEIIINDVSLPDHIKIFELKLPSGLKKLIIKAQSRNFDFILLNYLTKTNKKFNISKNKSDWKKFEFV